MYTVLYIDRDRDGPVYLPIFGLNKKLYKSPPPLRCIGLNL